MVQFKSYYEIWYFGLVAQIILMLILILFNLSKSHKAYIFLISYALLSIYTTYVVLMEFREGYFFINTPLLYMVLLASMPLMIGFDAITDKQRKIHHEKELKEKALIDSLTDNLTGVWNQRYLELKLFESEHPLTLAMIDLDDFKAINDNYGHLAGDYALREVSSIIQQNIRKSDDLCRYGGDEFIILFKDCDCQKVHAIMENIREMIEHKNFHFEKYQFRLTLSIGIHDVENAKLHKDIIKYVDKALYKAKKSGKNIVVKI